MSLIATAPTWRLTALAWSLPTILADRAMALEEEELRAFLARELPTHGRPLWRRRASNLVTDQGARWLISHGWVTASSILWYLMPKGAGALTNAHTMASHTGWSEVTAYNQTARQALTIAAPGASGRSSSNAAAVAAITANATTTVAGVVITSVNTKNTATGTLYGGADFTTPQALTSGQILQIAATVQF